MQTCASKKVVVTIFVSLLIFGAYEVSIYRNSHRRIYHPVQIVEDTHASAVRSTDAPEDFVESLPYDLRYYVAQDDVFRNADDSAVKEVRESLEYFEVLGDIDGQNFYVAYPKFVQSGGHGVSINIFCHGSGQTVGNTFDDEYVEALRKYGKYFADRGAVFVASNMHGDNYGSDEGMSDMYKLESWVRSKSLPSGFKYSDVTGVIGFSMGGLPALKYPLYIHEQKQKDSERRDTAKDFKMALLAPVINRTFWTQGRVEIIKPYGVAIWHGDRDVNVGLSDTKSAVQVFGRYGKDIDLHVVSGATHWDVDDELIPEVFQFLYSSE